MFDYFFILHQCSDVVGWFDEEENNVDKLSMRLAFSNRLFIFIQYCTAVFVSLLFRGASDVMFGTIGPLATLPVLTFSAINQLYAKVHNSYIRQQVLDYINLAPT